MTAADSDDVGDVDSGTPVVRAGEHGIPLHDMLGLEFSPPRDGTGVAVVSMPVTSAALGFTASLHGGAIATLVDVACALAAAHNSGFDWETQSLVTADMHIRYLGRPKTEMVFARSQVVRAGKTLMVVECKVDDGEGSLVAAADFSSMIVPLRAPIVEGVRRPEPEEGVPEL